MRIKEKKYQHRRDFEADFICEHCGNIEKDVSGYDDAYFHNEVIPTWKCKKCGKTADENYRPLVTKYSEEMQI